ncbi:unnamed protein product, partial [Rangifer tarandus platyrhynchus]
RRTLTDMVGPFIFLSMFVSGTGPTEFALCSTQELHTEEKSHPFDMRINDADCWVR